MPKPENHTHILSSYSCFHKLFFEYHHPQTHTHLGKTMWILKMDAVLLLTT